MPEIDQIDSNMIERPLTKEEWVEGVGSLKGGKAPGPDVLTSIS